MPTQVRGPPSHELELPRSPCLRPSARRCQLAWYRVQVLLKYRRISERVTYLEPMHCFTKFGTRCPWKPKCAPRSTSASACCSAAIDLFPPGPRDPQGIYKAIWDEFVEEDCPRPPDKAFTMAAFDAGPPRVAYAEFVAPGEVLPDVPLFLKPGFYVPTPLEAAYQTTWAGFPAPLKGLFEVAAS